jgi:VanZ family protein
MFRKLIIISAWVSIVMVFYGTMTDVGFVYSLYFKLKPFLMHTDMRSFARFEHIIAFACLGAIFSFAYPGRVVYVACAIFLAAVSLEYLQTWTPDRHGTFVDACEKIAGGALGVFTAHAFQHIARTRQSGKKEPL